MKDMTSWDWISWILLLIGGLNWGLIGAFDFDLVSTIFGDGTTLSRIVYVLIGISALYVIIKLAGKKK